MGRSGGAFRVADGITEADMVKLLGLLCREMPSEVVDCFIAELRLTLQSPVRFAEFAVSVEACLSLEDTFKVVLRLFEECDRSCRGCVPRDELLAALDARRRRELQQKHTFGTMANDSDRGAQELRHDDTSPLNCSFADLASAESLRDQLSDFDVEDDVTADDLFIALWRCWRRGSTNRRVASSSVRDNSPTK